jgi:hypothetical protein
MWNILGQCLYLNTMPMCFLLTTVFFCIECRVCEGACVVCVWVYNLGCVGVYCYYSILHVRLRCLCSACVVSVWLSKKNDIIDQYFFLFSSISGCFWGGGGGVNCTTTFLFSGAFSENFKHYERIMFVSSTCFCWNWSHTSHWLTTQLPARQVQVESCPMYVVDKN